MCLLAGDGIAAGPKLEYFVQISRELLSRVFFSKNLFYNSAYAKLKLENSKLSSSSHGIKIPTPQNAIKIEK